MTTYKEIFGKPIKVLSGDPAPTPITYTVTVANPGSGNVYYIDGVQTPTLELYEGNTYNFDYSAATGHPFRFATAADAAGSTEYTTGVSVDSNITTIVVASGAPNLFYYCTNHNGMGGRALTPASPDEYTGQIWYNETTGKFRSVVASGTWSSATSLPETNTNAGGAGIQTAALFFGGRSGGAQRTQTLEYNGLGYSAGGAMGTARQQMGTAGTQTSALAATGVVEGPSSCPTESEEYNGTSWTAGGSVSTARFASGGAGTQTSAVIAGGRLGPGTWSAVTEEYGGTSWTSGGALNQSKTLSSAITGSLTAAVAFGGDGNPPTAAVDDLTFYDGTSWTEVGSLPGVQRNGGSAGPQTASILFGGSTSPSTNAFRFDGTSFSATGSMASVTTSPAPAANASDNNTALSMGGYGSSAYLSKTEEYNFTANTVVQAAWSSGGNMGSALWSRAGGGTQTAAISAGGENPKTTNTELYDGTSWSEVNNLALARNQMGKAGTQTAFLVFGGEQGGGSPNYTQTESWDGSSWSEVNDLANARRNFAGFGTQTAAVAAGGFTPPGASTRNSVVEEWNGSSWSANPNALPANRIGADGIGTATAGLVVGGSIPAVTATTLEFDGTSFSSGGSMNTARSESGMTAGSQTNGLIAGGYTPSTTVATENYDGTSWTTRASMAQTRGAGSGLGSTSVSTAALAGGGYTGTAGTAATEEFNGGTTSLNYQNISSS